MAPVFDASSTAKGTAASLTFSHTCSGDDRYLKVTVGINFTDSDVTGVTYNGVALTLLSALENVMRDEFWYLIAPDTGAHDRPGAQRQMRRAHLAGPRRRQNGC